MKIFLTTLTFALFFTSNTFAQPEQGKYTIGGSAGFSHFRPANSNNSIYTTDFNINPSLGKFISDKYALNFNIGYTGSFGYNKTIKYTAPPNQTAYSSIERSRISSFSFGFGATRYFPITENLHFTVAATITPSYFRRSIILEELGTTKTSNDGISGRVNVSPGLTYFINPKWLVFTELALIQYNVDYFLDAEFATHTITSNINSNSFRLGVNYIFGGKK